MPLNYHSRSERTTTTSIAIIAIVLTFGILGSTAVNVFLMMTTTTPAYAAPSKERVIQRLHGFGGSAEWTDISVEVPGVGTVVYALLDVDGFEATGGIRTDIHVRLITEEGNCLEGFTTIDQNLFDTDNRLRSATLSPVTMEAVIFEACGGAIGTTEITIQATWEGTGDLSSGKFVQHAKSDNFSLKAKSSSLSRQASAEGSINNANLGTSDSAFFFAFDNVVARVSKNIIT